MKQPASSFSFKKNSDVSALPEAKPEHIAAIATKKVEKGKPGRKPESADGARKKQVSGYLTDAEWKKFNSKIDGRPAAAIVRNLILEYIKHG